MSQWKFISNHGIILIYVAKHPQAIAHDIAVDIGVRERTVRRIIAELVADGYLEKERVGRSNKYKINFKAPLRRPVLRNASVRDILKMLVPLFEVE